MKKKNSLIMSIAIAIIAMACNSEVVNVQSNSKTSSNQNSNIDARLPGGSSSSFTWITQNSNGEYVSTYGGGITFSTNFPHLTTVDPSGATDGQSMPGLTSVMFESPTATIYTVINGANFEVGQPSGTFIGGYLGTFSSTDDLLDYLNDIGIPNIQDITSIVVDGIVVRDHTSPTNASVAPASYVYSSPGNPTSDTYTLLAEGSVSSYTIQFYSSNSISTTSGPITKLVVTNSTGANVTVTSFSLTYSLSTSTYVYTINGNIQIGSTSLALNFKNNNDTFSSAY